ncbi:MAG TPA: Ig-like domain-containing protein, partial [Allosphingosinicella sp.]
SFSPDGTKLAFMSMATNLVPGDAAGQTDIFVKDLVTGAIERLSRNTLGQEGNGSSESPAFSPDGKKVVFASMAGNLVSGDGNGAMDLFIATLSDVPASYTENGTAAQVAPEVNVTDADSPNFGGGSLSVAITAGGSAGDQLSLAQSGTPGTGVEISGSSVSFNGVAVGTVSNSGTSITITLNASSSKAAVEALSEAIRISSTSDNPGSSTRTVTFTLNDGDGGNDTASFTRKVIFVPVDDAAVAQDDAVSTPENVIGTGDLFANNSSGPDSDVDGGSFVVTQITVGAQNYAPGTEIVMPSGAKLIVNADGTYSYNPNGKFNTLTDSSSGAVNTSTTGDTFSYSVTGGDTATVTVTVNGVAGPGDRLVGDGADNMIKGTSGKDQFWVMQAGSETLTGLGDNDAFLFGAFLDPTDYVDGGEGTQDELGIQGNYGTFGSGATPYTFGADNLLGIEVLSLIPGSDGRFGDTSNNSYSYNLKTVESNVASGTRLIVDFSRLSSGENVTFDGSAETDGGAFTFGAGKGLDNLTGGAGADLFLFRSDGRFGAGDKVDGGGGKDELALRGNYSGANSIVFASDTMTNIEVLSILSGQNARFGKVEGDFSYNLTTHNNNVGPNQRLVVDAGQLTANETLTFNGSAESDGFFWIAGGAGNDSLTGGSGDDLLIGAGGKDYLKGGAGADVYRFRSASESTSVGYDQIDGFVFGTDTLDLPGTHDSYQIVNGGALSTATFDSDLTAAMSSVLDADEAVFFTASTGDLAGRLFLVVDQDGIAGYQAGSDYVIEFLNTTLPVGPMPDFIL